LLLLVWMIQCGVQLLAQNFLRHHFGTSVTSLLCFRWPSAAPRGFRWPCFSWQEPLAGTAGEARRRCQPTDPAAPSQQDQQQPLTESVQSPDLPLPAAREGSTRSVRPAVQSRPPAAPNARRQPEKAPDWPGAWDPENERGFLHHGKWGQPQLHPTRMVCSPLCQQSRSQGCPSGPAVMACSFAEVDAWRRCRGPASVRWNRLLLAKIFLSTLNLDRLAC
jgi:hypothetical protein